MDVYLQDPQWLAHDQNRAHQQRFCERVDFWVALASGVSK